MKLTAAFSLLALCSTLASAQVLTVDDAAAKPKPLVPVLAKDHQGLGRVGVVLAFPKGALPEIASLTRGGPMADAGFKVGDVIVKVDKDYTSTLSDDEVRLALHGPPGSGVEFTVQRSDDPHYIVVAVERRVLTPYTEELTPPRSYPAAPGLKQPTTQVPASLQPPDPQEHTGPAVE